MQESSRQRIEPPTGPNLRDYVQSQLDANDGPGPPMEGNDEDQCQSADEDEDVPKEQSADLLEMFDRQCSVLESRAFEQKKRAQLTVCNRQDTAFETSSESVSFERHASDAFSGDARLRALRSLLAVIDKNGFERSANQVRFHDAFIRACGRVLYKDDWSIHRTKIMSQNGWLTTPGEVMISTPRYAADAFFPCRSLQPPCNA